MGIGCWKKKKESRLVGIEKMMGGIYDQYDAIADELMASSTPNTKFGLASSNLQMAEFVKRVMEVDEVDVLGEHHFDQVVDSTNTDLIVACSFIALLRFQTFSAAREREVGIPGITITAQAYSEYWYLRLKDRLDSLSDPKSVTGRWLH